MLLREVTRVRAELEGSKAVTFCCQCCIDFHDRDNEFVSRDDLVEHELAPSLRAFECGKRPVFAVGAKTVERIEILT